MINSLSDVQLSSVQQSIMELTMFFPTNVLVKAAEEYSKLDIPTPRSKHRKKIICYCIYQAYIEIGSENVVDPVSIGIKLGLSKTDARLAINNRPKYKTGEKSKSPTITMVDMMRKYVSSVLNLPEDIVSSMTSTFVKVVEVDPSVLGFQAKQIVAAFIYVYLTYNSMTTDISVLCSAFYLHPSTIVPARKIIKSIITENNLA